MNQLITTLVRSEEWVQVRRRIFRQLIESLLYEQIISEPVIRLHATSEYVLHGESHIGEKVKYTFYAVRKESFHRIQLTDAPIMRITSLERTEADSIPQFLQEISSHFQVSEAQLGQFIDELQQTHLKDTLSKRWDHTHWKPLLSEYDEWESAMTEGHPYHPCYKSRIGFTLPDNTLYGPEFKPEFRLEWIAIQRDATIVSLSDSLITYTQFIQSELEQEWDMLMSTLQDNSLDEDTYILLPVHPWQWERIAETCADQLRTGEMVYLGQAGDTYRPQQSIRTMTNVTSRDKPYVKLPLNIVNTSSGRILAQHTIMNSARISDWLGRVVATDTFLQKEIQLIVLKEIAGVSYNHQKLPSLFEQKIYGSLGAIWRESLHPYLNDGENALPFNALCHLDLQNSPIIDPWVREYGLEPWIKNLLSVAIVPLIHLLYAHGTALESHAQNMIIVLNKGLPVRVALKDFHDGIRYSPSICHPFGYPNIEYPPANHQRINRNSFVEKEDLTEVKDFLLDALLFINLTELAFVMEKYYGLSEKQWWSMVVEVIVNYQERFPELKERYELFDVFAPEIVVEQLTRRRIYEESGDCVHKVPNPLYAFRPVSQN